MTLTITDYDDRCRCGHAFAAHDPDEAENTTTCDVDLGHCAECADHNDSATNALPDWMGDV